MRPLPDCLGVCASARPQYVMTHVHTRPTARAIGLPLAAVIVLATGCAQTSAQHAAPPPPQVTVASVIERDVTEWDEFTGRLQAVDSVEVRPRVSGYVSAVRFSEGRSEERRVGKECRSRGWAWHEKK